MPHILWDLSILTCGNKNFAQSYAMTILFWEIFPWPRVSPSHSSIDKYSVINICLTLLQISGALFLSSSLICSTLPSKFWLPYSPQLQSLLLTQQETVDSVWVPPFYATTWQLFPEGKLVPLQISTYLFSFTQALQPCFAVVQFLKAIVSYNSLVSYLFKAKGRFTLHSNILARNKSSISLLFKNTFTI